MMFFINFFNNIIEPYHPTYYQSQFSIFKLNMI